MVAYQALTGYQRAGFTVGGGASGCRHMGWGCTGPLGRKREEGGGGGWTPFSARKAISELNILRYTLGSKGS